MLDEPDDSHGHAQEADREPAEEHHDPNVVKVVTDLRGERDLFLPLAHSLCARRRETVTTLHFKHIGLYVYRRDFLLRYSDLPVGPLEKAERLEQLRALENGFQIRVVETEYESLGVDTPEDLERVAKLFEAEAIGG